MNNYRRYKKHAVRNTEDDVARLVVLFQESALYRHIDGREVNTKEKFADVWSKGFNIVSKGESLARWFEHRNELQPVAEKSVTEGYSNPTFSKPEEMDWEDDCEYIINLCGHA